MKHLKWSVATIALIGWGGIASATETLTMLYHGAGNEVESKIINQIIRASMAQSIEGYQSLYEHGRPLMEFIQDTGMPVPRIFFVAAQPVLNDQLKSALTQEEVDPDAVQRIIDQIRKWNVEIDRTNTEYFLRMHMQKLTHALVEEPGDLKLMAKIEKLMELIRSIPIDVVLWQMQNDYYVLAKTTYREYLEREHSGEEGAGIWLEAFRKLGDTLRFNLDAVLAVP